jgi:hypothetical protein
MTTALADACGQLAEWLPRAQALTAEPDTIATMGHAQPSSRPPWNPAAATIVYDVHEGVRRLEDALRTEAGLPERHRGGSGHNTGRAITAIGQLSYQADRSSATTAARTITRWVITIRQLPAIDDTPRWHRIPAICPYCGHGMLRVAPRSGTVTCLRHGVCYDRDGNHPIGRLEVGMVSAEPYLIWADGTIQAGAA